MKVSLYIPCFNAEKTLRACLEAVFKQRYPLDEILVIDDGSCDQTVKIASGYPVKIIRHKTNKGLAASRNTAIRNTEADFVASLDADCIPESDWLAELMKKFDASKTAGAGGRLLEIYSSRIFDLWRSAHMKQDWGEQENSPIFLFGSNSVFRKEAILKAGLYKEEFKTNYEDVDISRRLKEEGWVLIYVPKAVVYHQKRDNIYSLLNTYWQWNLGYYQKRKFYSNLDKLIFKAGDNIGLANRYIEEDLASKRCHLLYLDFLFALHHSLKDLEYFIFQNNQKKPHIEDFSPAYSWLALLDLTFFYHLNSEKKNLPTLIPKAGAFLQNHFALNLILGRFIQNKFRNDKFKKILYKDLFFSLYKIDDNVLSDGLLNLVELHQDWAAFLGKEQPNLNKPFLESLSLSFQKWLESLTCRFPGIIEMLETSAEKTNGPPLSLKEDFNDENK